MRNPGTAALLVIMSLTACAAAPVPNAGSAGSDAPAAMPGGPDASASAPATPRAAAANGAASAPAGPRRRGDGTPPYFAGDMQGFFHVMPAAPRDGDARDQADRRIFRETRALADTPRWQMAIEDAELGTGAMLEHFSCSLGIQPDTQQAPRLVALLQKSMREAARTVGSAKDHYQRKRPFLVDEGATCVPADTIGDSFDYPSGHTTAGWAWALVLAQVDPGNAQSILQRGRAIGDSRVVCGMHNASAVEAARLLTSSAMAVIAASPLYQADVVVARAELQALREDAAVNRPQPEKCALERELAAASWW